MGDFALALVLAAVSAVELALGSSDAALTAGFAGATAISSLAIVFRRRAPLSATAITAAVCFIPGVVIGAPWWNGVPLGPNIALLVLAFSCGWELAAIPGFVGMLLASLGFSGGELESNALVLMWVFTIPAWLVGTVMRSRDRIAAQLAEQAAELERERTALAREAVRYERARIARDLHDIVAHRISLIVLQAGGSRRALDSDPTAAAASFEHIAAAAQQAEADIARLMDLLGSTKPDTEPLDHLDALIEGAAASGLDVRCVITAGTADLRRDVAEVAYRTVQEGLTNALKHAPGAPVRIQIDAAGAGLQITIENDAPSVEPSTLRMTGGGYGLAGICERVESLHGFVTASPKPDGGWLLEVEIPRATLHPEGERPSEKILLRRDDAAEAQA